MSKTLVAMSGGVDSAVTAHLIKKAGDEAAGITFQMFDKTDPRYYPSPCANPNSEISEAKKVSELVGIPHYTKDCSDDFAKYVIDNFVDSYLRGDTPNPCVICNKHIKFSIMMDSMRPLGYDKIATGHYARIEESNGRYLIRTAKDKKKDQSYVLYSLSQEQLSAAKFPLGEYTKDEVREIAASMNFENAKKQDSQDICFIPDGDFFSFIKRYCKKIFPNGSYIDKSGNILGSSEYAAKYTTGQRKGLGIALGQPMFVLSKDIVKNTVTLGTNDDLFTRALDAHSINLIPFDTLNAPMRVQAKIRYKHIAANATIEQTSKNTFHLEFDSPQRAITSGQSVVIYDGEYVIGGGIIS